MSTDRSVGSWSLDVPSMASMTLLRSRLHVSYQIYRSPTGSQSGTRWKCTEWRGSWIPRVEITPWSLALRWRIWVWEIRRYQRLPRVPARIERTVIQGYSYEEEES